MNKKLLKKIAIFAFFGLMVVAVISAVQAERLMFDNNSLTSTQDDMVNGVKLRGDGTVDDNSFTVSHDDMVNGVKLRGDGTVDDNSASHLSGRNRGSSDGMDDNSGSGRGRDGNRGED